jgi:exopolysaccharide biosynthesis polyprenyl glycosylphosphotransferase
MDLNAQTEAGRRPSAEGGPEVSRDQRVTDPDAATTPQLPVLDARRLADLITLGLVPALVGGALTLQHTDALTDALLVFGTILGVNQVAERVRYPLHLMPAARFTLYLAAPVLGVLLAFAFGFADGSEPRVGQLIVPVVGAWLTLVLGALVNARVKSDRHVRVAVVGPRRLARALAAELELAEIESYEIVGWIGPDRAARSDPGGLERLGSLEELRSVVLGRRIDLLVPAAHEQRRTPGEGEPETGLLELVADSCLDLPVRMIDANQLYEDLLGHVPLGTVDAAWFRYVMHPRYRAGSPLSKRLVDVGLILIGSVIAVPLLLVAAIAIKLTDRGPILFRQRRVGEHGEEFEIMKLRTMRPGTEAPDAPRWTTANDERITRAGRILRRTHVDELPQLWNVLRGEMTLVGPRPERPELVAWLEQQFPHYERRHLVKPGITGWAQIRCGYGGSETGTAWKLCHDLYYFKHRSLVADMLLLMESVSVIAADAHRFLPTPSTQFLLREASES